MSSSIGRRAFLAKSAVAGGTAALAAVAACASSAAAPDAGGEAGAKRQVYELGVYQMASADMTNRAEAYFADALVPALRRAGTGPVGVFVESVKPNPPKANIKPDAAKPEAAKAERPAVYVLTPHDDWASVLKVRAALEADPAYQKAGAAFLAAPPKDPAYVNYDARLMLAAAFLPKLEAPQKAETRVFELRRYRNPSESAFRKKLEMFATAELTIFRRVGLNPVFFGEMLYGPDMFNITYMLTYPDPTAKGKAWGAFGGDPDWKKLRVTPGYTDAEIIANIKSVMLKPMACSQV